MKKVFIILICITVTGCLLQSCGSKSVIDKEIDKAEKLLDKASKDKGKWTEEDWIKFNEQIAEPLKAIVDASESEKVGALKKIKIAGLLIKYATVTGTHALDLDKSNIENYIKKSIESGAIKIESAEPDDDKPEVVEPEVVEPEKD